MTELRPSPDLALLRSLTARCGGASAPTPVEVEQALEHGFAALMTFEAQLQRSSDARDVAVLAEQIGELRAVLTDLRVRTESGASAPLALGFVLPPKR